MSPTDQEESYYFPPELLTEIIARLPVKSILRFRCVSKYWLHRIPDPILIYSHLHHITAIKYNTSSIHSLPILTFEHGVESKYFKIRSVNNYEDSVILMTAPATYSTLVINDGLVLMLDDTTHTKELMLVNPILKTSLILVNPTLNTSLVLPPCPIRHSCSRVVYAMGFIPSTNDFKVFAFRIPLTDEETLITAVYTLNHGCWTTRNIVFDNRYILSGYRVLYTKGKVHWLATCSDLWKLVTFDIDSERFSYLGLPPEYVDRDDRGKIHTNEGLFSVGGSVALWCVSELFEIIYIWVLDEVGDGDMMWRQLYHGVLASHTIYFFSHVMPRRSKFWFDDKCGKFYIANKSLLCSYDLRGDEFEYLGCSRHTIYDADTYVESLLLFSHPGADQPRA